MDLYLYKTTDASNVIGKTLTDEKHLNINLKKSEPIESPVLRLTIFNGIQTFNYAEIPFLHRKYFIEKCELGNLNIATLTLTVDVLETYKDDILKSNALITHKTGLGYADTSVTVDSRKDVELYKSGVTIDKTKTTTLLTTVGG